jgi:DNA-binding transcriptional LysR family regulator
VPVTISQTVLAPIMPEFLRRQPQVKLVMRVTNRVVDLFEDEIDVALHVRSDPPASANIYSEPVVKVERVLG